MSVYKYRVRCLTDNKWETVWSETPPTKCPVNTAHTIEPSLTATIDKKETSLIEIKEETEPTGGHFQTTTIVLQSNGYSTGTAKVHWPFNVTALAVNFVTGPEHEGDVIHMYAGKDTPVGTITANLIPATAWVDKDYTVGDKVIYTDPYNYHEGSRIYTCVANTVANAIPVDLTSPIFPENLPYWKHGYEVPVSDTVLDNTEVGFYASLSDGANVTDMCRVISIDTISKKVYLEENVMYNYSWTTPTVYRQRIYFIKDYVLNKSWERQIGRAKIGGAHIPKNVYVHAEYINNSANAKILPAHAEITY